MTDIHDIITRARDVGPSDFKPIPDGFGAGKTRSDAFRVATIAPGGKTWVVCRAPMLSSRFRLLDAAVRQVLERRNEATVIAGGVAILEPRPEKDGHGAAPGERYLRRFQQAVWSAFGIAWVLDGDDTSFLADTETPAASNDAFDRIAKDVDAELVRSSLTALPAKSRDAEDAVRPIVGRVLERLGLAKAASSRYAGFWRSPYSDGIWERKGDAPLSIALEVKLHEDLGTPLCQAVEPLGRVDGVIYVRVGSDSLKPGPTADLAKQARNLLEGKTPVRFFNLKVGA